MTPTSPKSLEQETSETRLRKGLLDGGCWSEETSESMTGEWDRREYCLMGLLVRSEVGCMIAR